MSHFHRQLMRGELLQKRLNYILQLKKIENAFFLHLLQAAVVNYVKITENKGFTAKAFTLSLTQLVEQDQEQRVA